MEDQCPTCGRVSQDWAERKFDLKGKRRSDSEDRLKDYRGWRWGAGGRELLVTDLDQIEYAFVDGEPIPVAVLELSRVDGDVKVPPSYLRAVLDRFQKRDAQGKVSCHLASRLGCKCWIVLFRYDLSEFWVFNLSDSRGWWNLSQPVYERWLERLHCKEMV